MTKADSHRGRVSSGCSLGLATWGPLRDFALVGGELVIAPPSSAGAVGVDLHVNLRGPVCSSGSVRSAVALLPLD